MAFVTSRSQDRLRYAMPLRRHLLLTRSRQRLIENDARLQHYSSKGDSEQESNDLDLENLDDAPVNIIRRGSEQDDVPDEVWENIETGEPPQWLVLKELLGINVFTYVLAVSIVAFLSLNALLGPGWLGQAIGLKGTGYFTDVSSSLPNTIDLNTPENLL